MPNIKQIIPEKFCLKCDGCCRFTEKNSVWFPRLLKTEENIIPKDKFRIVLSGKNQSFICSFFNEKDNKCGIYGIRPFECRLYPFLLSRGSESGKVFLAVDTNCRFAEENLEKPAFKEHADYLAALFNIPDFSELIKNNPQIVQSYSGVTDLAELKI